MAGPAVKRLPVEERGAVDPKETVRRGYDLISHTYRPDEGGGMDSDYAGWLLELVSLLSDGDPVLELGCGCGVPVAQILSSTFTYTGVDISPVQIERAVSLVPYANFILADMSELSFADASFAAVVSLYAIIHIPLAEQPDLLRNIAAWLQPGGYFLAIVGDTAWTGREEDWLGAEMYWSHADFETYRSWLLDLDFEIIWSRFIPEGDGGHQLLLARKEKE